MARLEFIDLAFLDEETRVKVIFLKHFYFYISKKDLEKIGKFKILKNSLDFEASEKRIAKFYDYLETGLNNLTSQVTGKKTIYLHKGCGIPLLGNGSFGIVDRGSNLLEIKPVCGCNLSCIYCSVDEDKRAVDFLIEKDYLVEELNKVVSIKKGEVEIHIGCQGEPLLYEPLVDLVENMRRNPKIKRISIDTNATLLTPDKVDELIDAGLTRFNLSINSLDEALSKKIAGGYSVKHAKSIAEYISKKGVSLTIAPVFLKDLNEEDMESIVEFGKRIGADIGIQNFLKYQFGKNPAKEIPMDDFYDKLKALEGKTGAKLILSASDFDIKDDNQLKKPFRKDEIVEANIVCQGRLPDEMIAVCQNRTISVFGCKKKIGSRTKIKITREKHNIYSGKCI